MTTGKQGFPGRRKPGNKKQHTVTAEYFPQKGKIINDYTKFFGTIFPDIKYETRVTESILQGVVLAGYLHNDVLRLE